MMRHLKLAAITAALLFAAPIAAIAHGYTLGALKIGHPWCRPTPNAAPTAAGYLTITNSGTTPDRLLGGTTPLAATIEVHDMSMTGGIMRMRPISGGLVLPPGQTVTLGPDGAHLMIIGPKQPFKIGDHIPAVLRFEHAGEIKVQFYVQTAPVEGGAMKAMPGMH